MQVSFITKGETFARGGYATSVLFTHATTAQNPYGFLVDVK